MHRFQVNLTEEQMEFLERRSKETGTPKGSYLRMVLKVHMSEENPTGELIERVREEPSGEFVELLNRLISALEGEKSQESCKVG